MIPVSHFLILGAILFSIGLVIAISRRNAIMVLIGIELMLNATNINFIAFSSQYGNDTNGQFFAVFVMVIAACEAAVALAIILKIYQYFNTSDLDQVDQMSE